MSKAGENEREPGPRSLGGVVKGLMHHKELARRHRVNRDLVMAWLTVAGEQLASHTAVRGLRRGTLTIEVDSGPLCHELAAFRSEELLLALRERIRRADVQSLRFRVGSLD